MVSRLQYVTGRGALDLLSSQSPAAPPATSELPLIIASPDSSLTVANPISVADGRSFIGISYGGTSNYQFTSVVNVADINGVGGKAWSQLFSAGTWGMPGNTDSSGNPSNGTGIALTSAPLPGNYTEATIDYDVRFVGSGTWPQGGKLPGLGGLRSGVGGGVPTGGNPSPDGWSGRDMFRRYQTSQAMWRGYVYDPTQDAGAYGQDRVTGQFFNWSTWYHLRKYYKMNTVTSEGSVGAANGIHRMYLNGSLCFENTSQVWRLHSSYGINYLVWDNFCGGADASWAPPADMSCQFKNLVIRAA